ncbi:hypothetical protein ACFX1Q_015878 [Malus domestica]|uniref:NAC domain-containing protein 1-like n=1 Tax=Malus domestica TaxID=3750 RepID=UPI003975EDC2
MGKEDNMWYFFTPRDKKYPKGTRLDRAAGNGYWKVTGVKKDVMLKNVKVGFKTSLVFYEGKSPNGKKSDWLMHEFNVEAPPKKAYRNNIKLDDWVLCRVYMKLNKAKKLKASNQSHDVNQVQE